MCARVTKWNAKLKVVGTSMQTKKQVVVGWRGGRGKGKSVGFVWTQKCLA